MKNLNYSRKKLFDGFENQLFDEDFELEIGNQTITFIADDLTTNKLSQLNDNRIIVNDLSLEVKNSIIITKDKNLQTYYLIVNDFIIIFSMGEYQPGRYMLFFEGAFEKDS